MIFGALKPQLQVGSGHIKTFSLSHILPLRAATGVMGISSTSFGTLTFILSLKEGKEQQP